MLRRAIAGLTIFAPTEPVQERDDHREQGNASQDSEGVFHYRAPISHSAVTTSTIHVVAPATMTGQDIGC